MFGWLQDKLIHQLNKNLPPEQQARVWGGWSHDWCRFRKDQRCMFPKELNKMASNSRGYPVWLPIDRGWCNKHQWEEQRICPIAAPGPNADLPESQEHYTAPAGQRYS